VLGCICCLCCTGPLVILLGVIFLLSATNDTRSDLVNQYNAAVSEWNAAARAQFAIAGNFSVLAKTGTATLVPNTTADPINDSGDDLDSYTPLKYSIVAPVLNSVIYTGQDQDQQYLTFEWNNTSPNKTFYQFAVPTITLGTQVLGPNQLSQKCNVTGGNPNCAQVCHNEGGQWNSISQTCTIFQEIVNFCTKLSYDNVSKWLPDNSYGGIGCTYGPYGDWYPEGYETYPVPSYNSPVNFPPTPLMLRSVKDPWVVAQYLTDGSLSFGLSTGQKIGIGMILIIVGACLELPICLGVFCLVKMLSNRNKLYQVNYSTGYTAYPTYSTLA